MPPECKCIENGQPMTSVGVMHSENCAWLKHPQGGRFNLTEPDKEHLLNMIKEEEDND